VNISSLAPLIGPFNWGTLTVDEIKKYGYSKSLPEIHLNQKSYLIHQNFVTNPSKLQAIRSAIMNNR
jgi:hypothetical protein